MNEGQVGTNVAYNHAITHALRMVLVDSAPDNCSVLVIGTSASGDTLSAVKGLFRMQLEVPRLSAPAMRAVLHQV